MLYDSKTLHYISLFFFCGSCCCCAAFFRAGASLRFWLVNYKKKKREKTTQPVEKCRNPAKARFVLGKTFLTILSLFAQLYDFVCVFFVLFNVLLLLMLEVCFVCVPECSNALFLIENENIPRTSDKSFFLLAYRRLCTLFMILVHKRDSGGVLDAISCLWFFFVCLLLLLVLHIRG